MIAVPVVEMAWVPMVSYRVVAGRPAAVEAHESISAMVIWVDASVAGIAAPLIRYIETIPWPDHTVA